jgi:hypothetical protein
MSFGESVFLAGFIQKTVKVHLDVRISHAYPKRKQPQKVLEDLRGHHTEVEGEAPPGGPGWPAPGPTYQPPVAMSVLHHLKDCIYVVYSSRFDPRAQD